MPVDSAGTGSRSHSRSLVWIHSPQSIFMTHANIYACMRTHARTHTHTHSSLGHSFEGIRDVSGEQVSVPNERTSTGRGSSGTAEAPGSRLMPQPSLTLGEPSGEPRPGPHTDYHTPARLCVSGTPPVSLTEIWGASCSRTTKQERLSWMSQGSSDICQHFLWVGQAAFEWSHAFLFNITEPCDL